MTAQRTEALHPNAKELDTQSLRDIAALLSKSQTEAAATTMNCLNAIASGASAIAITLKYDQTLHYIAAGSSGLMAAADAMELGGTFSIPAHQIKIHMAGGLPTDVVMPAMELYNNPTNQFVAGFLGSPAMNFIPASLMTDGDTRTMGVRPEDLSVQSGGPLSVTVSYVKKLGGDTNVIAHIGAHQITARLFGQHSIMDGQTLTLGFDAKSALYFDDTGARLRS